jgi:pimeloyl-ACP methyl ester carboxylesterase
MNQTPNFIVPIKREDLFFEASDGCRIYLESRGEGEPIVFIYGLACPPNHWHNQLDFFAGKNQVYSFNLRGHHRSELGPTKNLKLDRLALDLIEFCEAFKISKAHFVGHSFGVPLLLKASAGLGDKAKSYSFIGGFIENPFPSIIGDLILKNAAHLLRNQYQIAPDFWLKLWKWVIDNPLFVGASGLIGGFNLRHTPIKDVEIYAKGVANLSLEAFFPLFDEIFNLKLGEVASKINTNCLVIGGEKDLLTPPSVQHKLVAALPKGHLLIIPYASHCPHLDFPDYLNLKLENFFETI